MSPEMRTKYLEMLGNTTKGYRIGVIVAGRGLQVEVTFPDVHAAASWAKTFKMSSHVVPDQPLIALDAPVTLVFSLATYAERTALFTASLGK